MYKIVATFNDINNKRPFQVLLRKGESFKYAKRTGKVYQILHECDDVFEALIMYRYYYEGILNTKLKKPTNKRGVPKEYIKKVWDIDNLEEITEPYEQPHREKQWLGGHILNNTIKEMQAHMDHYGEVKFEDLAYPNTAEKLIKEKHPGVSKCL